jgi:hypothetical protein
MNMAVVVKSTEKYVSQIVLSEREGEGERSERRE